MYVSAVHMPYVSLVVFILCMYVQCVHFVREKVHE